MAESKVEKQSKPIVDSYRDIVIHSIMKPASLALELYLFTPSKANLLTLNTYIDQSKYFLSFLKAKKISDTEEMSQLLLLLENSIKDMEYQVSITPLSATTVDKSTNNSIYKKTIDQVKKNLQIQNLDIINYSLVLCNLDLALLQQDIIDATEKNNITKIIELTNFEKELEKMKETCEILIKK